MNRKIRFEVRGESDKSTEFISDSYPEAKPQKRAKAHQVMRIASRSTRETLKETGKLSNL